jgi:hypothetical protein
MRTYIEAAWATVSVIVSITLVYFLYTCNRELDASSAAVKEEDKVNKARCEKVCAPHPIKASTKEECWCDTAVEVRKAQ